jgi:8-oxo-dGTP pyrophosphatase MutT (NUDIX family)
MSDETNPWTFLTGRTVYENPWIRVEHHEVLRPDGQPGIYGLVKFANRAIGVLPIEADGRVHLVGQWRVPLQRYSWEIPEGGVGADEDLMEGALRELAEETGLRCGRLIPILKMALSNSTTDEEAWCFIALELTPGPAAPDGTERLKHRAVPFMTALNAALGGDIDDAITVASLLRAHHMAVTGALPAALAQAMLKPSEGP